MILNVVSIFMLGLVALVSPGPDFIIMLRNSTRGQRAAMQTALGISLGCFLQNSLCVLGISALLQANEHIYQTVRYLGGLYLIYLSFKCFSHLRMQNSEALKLSAEIERGHGASSFREAFLCNILNPNCSLFLLSVFAQFTHQGTPLGERIAYGATLWGQSFVYWLVLAHILQERRVQQIFLRSKKIMDPLFGVVLAALGLHLTVFQ